MDSFALDNSVIVLPVWNGDEDWLTLYEDKFRTFFLVRSDRRKVHILAEDKPGFRIPLMRVLREFAMNHCIRKEGVFLHASGVAFGGRGLLIVGSSNAGKTSLLTHFLRNSSAHYVSNDRVYVKQEGGGLMMWGMPTIATIRSTMLPLFPELEGQIQASTFFHRSTVQESAEDNRALRPWGDGRYGLTPAQFMKIHRARPQAQAVPQAMLFPRVTHKPGTMRAARLNPEEVAQRYPQALFAVSTWRNEAEVFNLGQAGLPAVEELLVRCRNITAALPCYEVQLGTESYSSPAVTDQLLEQVLGDE